MCRVCMACVMAYLWSLQALYPTVRDDTFFASCGVADLIATCWGGRNRLVSEAWTKAQLLGQPKSFEILEKVREHHWCVVLADCM